MTLGANTLTIGVKGGSWLNPGYFTGNPTNSNGAQPDFLGSISGTGGIVFQLPQGATDPAYVFGGTNAYSGATTVASGCLRGSAV